MADYNSRDEFFGAIPKKHHKKVEKLFPVNKQEFSCDDYILACRSVEPLPTHAEAGMRKLAANGGYSSKKYDHGDIIKRI